ncbi:uncharacterized protein LOC121700736 [Alosa sapidissima]|uniref:uncharacterized protein LOC121700736 n=1 Tax=Alosa sapidissima TaxID=34773 RepID=UPI001C09CF5A|nr:uncharacterized protein LOC121700736 [Alosa sapidissima]
MEMSWRIVWPFLAVSAVLSLQMAGNILDIPNLSFVLSIARTIGNCSFTLRLTLQFDMLEQETRWNMNLTFMEMSWRIVWPFLAVSAVLSLQMAGNILDIPNLSFVLSTARTIGNCSFTLRLTLQFDMLEQETRWNMNLTFMEMSWRIVWPFLAVSAVLSLQMAGNILDIPNLSFVLSIARTIGNCSFTLRLTLQFDMLEQETRWNMNLTFMEMSWRIVWPFLAVSAVLSLQMAGNILDIPNLSFVLSIARTIGNCSFTLRLTLQFDMLEQETRWNMNLTFMEMSWRIVWPFLAVSAVLSLQMAGNILDIPNLSFVLSIARTIGNCSFTLRLTLQFDMLEQETRWNMNLTFMEMSWRIVWPFLAVSAVLSLQMAGNILDIPNLSFVLSTARTIGNCSFTLRLTLQFDMLEQETRWNMNLTFMEMSWRIVWPFLAVSAVLSLQMAGNILDIPNLSFVLSTARTIGNCSFTLRLTLQFDMLEQETRWNMNLTFMEMSWRIVWPFLAVSAVLSLQMAGNILDIPNLSFVLSIARTIGNCSFTLRLTLQFDMLEQETRWNMNLTFMEMSWRIVWPFLAVSAVLSLQMAGNILDIPNLSFVLSIARTIGNCSFTLRLTLQFDMLEQETRWNMNLTFMEMSWRIVWPFLAVSAVLSLQMAGNILDIPNLSFVLSIARTIGNCSFTLRLTLQFDMLEQETRWNMNLTFMEMSWRIVWPFLAVSAVLSLQMAGNILDIPNLSFVLSTARTIGNCSFTLRLTLQFDMLEQETRWNMNLTFMEMSWRIVWPFLAVSAVLSLQMAGNILDIPNLSFVLSIARTIGNCSFTLRLTLQFDMLEQETRWNMNLTFMEMSWRIVWPFLAVSAVLSLQMAGNILDIPNLSFVLSIARTIGNCSFTLRLTLQFDMLEQETRWNMNLTFMEMSWRIVWPFLAVSAVLSLQMAGNILDIPNLSFVLSIARTIGNCSFTLRLTLQFDMLEQETRWNMNLTFMEMSWRIVWPFLAVSAVLSLQMAGNILDIPNLSFVLSIARTIGNCSFTLRLTLQFDMLEQETRWNMNLSNLYL